MECLWMPYGLSQMTREEWAKRRGCRNSSTRDSDKEPWASSFKNCADQCAVSTRMGFTCGWLCSWPGATNSLPSLGVTLSWRPQLLGGEWGHSTVLDVSPPCFIGKVRRMQVEKLLPWTGRNFSLTFTFALPLLRADLPHPHHLKIKIFFSLHSGSPPLMFTL